MGILAEFSLTAPCQTTYRRFASCCMDLRDNRVREDRGFATVTTGQAPDIAALSLLADSFSQLATLNPAQWQEYVVAHGSLFYNAFGFDIPLWESSFRTEEALLLDKHTLHVQRLYQAQGLRVRRSVNELPDALGIEAAFVAFLLSRNDQKAAEDASSFAQEHLIFLLGSIISYCASLNFDSHYQSLIVSLLDAFLLSIKEFIAFAGRASAQLDSPSQNQRELRDDVPGIVWHSFEHLEGEVPPARTVIRSAGRNNCGGRCSFDAEVEDGCVLSLGFSEQHSPCVKYCTVRSRGYHSTYLSHRRIRYPLKRIGQRGEGRFVRISWQEALETIAHQWRRITDAYGPSSRYISLASGVSAVFRPDALAKRLAALDGGFLNWHNAYSSACTEVATPYVYGSLLCGSHSTHLRHSQFIILWGNNPVETIMSTHLMPALLEAKARGVRIVVVDPRKNATAQLLDAEWIAPLPTTDGALMDAMAFTIVNEGLADRAFLDTHCLGFDAAHLPEGTAAEASYLAYLEGACDGIAKTPEWAAGICDLPVEVIIDLARSYASAKPAALITGLGLQRHSNGEQNVRGAILLAALTGNVGVPGGHSGGLDMTIPRPAPFLPPLQNPANVSIPSFLWTDALFRAHEMTAQNDGIRGADRLETPIKLIMSLAGDMLINQHSDTGRTARLLKDTTLCEFIVVSDVFMTPSARFADILLPATSLFESANITTSPHDGDHLYYNNAVIEPLFESRFEYDWLKELADDRGLYQEFTEGHETADEWLAHLYDKLREHYPQLPDFTLFKKDGVYRHEEQEGFIAFKEQISNPAEHPFPTPSGKIELFSPRLFALDNPLIPGTPRYIPAFEGPEDPLKERYPFQLVGWHSARRAHSTFDNNPWLDRFEKPSVHINPVDAATLAIREGDLVELFNERGCVRTTAHVTDAIRTKVLAVAQGAWYVPDEEGVDIRGNINTLTTSRPTPLAKGNPQHSNLVDIRRVSRQHSH
jgi:anaerobic dimethyl sulfoxide reductase subunit A